MVRKKTIITICLIIVLPVWVAEQFISPVIAATETGTRCEKAKLKLWDIKSLIQRQSFLVNALEECPHDAMLQYYYGVNLDRRQQFEKALHYFKISAQLDNLFPYVYFGMGESYLSLGDLEAAVNAYKKGLKIQPDNKWGIKRINEILAFKNTSAPVRTNTSASETTIQQPDQQIQNIADRYGIHLDKLMQAKKQMSSLKKIAERYNLQLDTLIREKKKQLSKANQTKSSPNKDSKKMAEKKSQKKYLADISKHYGIKLDELSKINDQISSLKKIADRYGIQLDDLMQNDKQAPLFESKRIIVKEHKVVRNEYLSEIANRYGVPVEELVKANKQITDPHLIFPGQVIKIPGKTNP